MIIPTEVVDLLICCAGVDPEKGPKLEALISQGVDWNLVIQQGQRHGILPLLYWSFKTHCPDRVPDPIMKELGDFFQGNARKNLFAISELLRILGLLAEKGIMAIPFKGPVLTSILYGNPALRCYGDLDILISQKDFFLVRNVLTAVGYSPITPLNSSCPEGMLFRSSYEYSFYSNINRRQIDVHWGVYLDWIFEPMKGDLWWSRVEKTSLGGKSILTLSAEDLLLVMSIHGSIHCWSHLKWVSDLAKLIELREMDWSYVIRQATFKKCRRMTYTSLLLANRLLKAPVPDLVLHMAEKDNKALLLAKKVHDRFYSNVQLGILACQLPMVVSNDHFTDRLRYCVWVALTPRLKDWQSLPLPNYLHFIYYLIRPIRLFKTYVLGFPKGKTCSAHEVIPSKATVSNAQSNK